MRITGVVLILFLLLQEHPSAQLNPGARQVSLSNSDIALSDDVFSLFNNPAGLAQIKCRQAGIYYSPSPFGFKELSNSFLAYTEPLPFGSIAAGIMKFGFALYNELKILMGFSYRNADNLFAGISLTYHTVTISKYGSDQSLYFDMGVIFRMYDKIKLGFCLHNANRSTFGKEEGQIPVIFSSGLTFEPVDALSLNFAVEKDLLYKASVRSGIEYNILDFLYLRTGYAAEPSKYSAGIGIIYLLFNIDYAVFTHQDLGLTHQAGLIISFSKEGYQ